MISPVSTPLQVLSSRTLVTLTSCLLLSTALWGAGGDKTDEPSPPSAGIEETITVIATRGPHDIHDVPSTVTVVDSEAIDLQLMTQMGDLVRHVPGISWSGGAGDIGGGFNIRGVGGNRVLTLVDGVAEPEEFEFSRFFIPRIGVDLSSVGTVEVVRGGHSSLFGSDALGGVVSVATKDPDDYLLDRPRHYGGNASWDGRDDSLSLGGSGAVAHGSWRFSVNAVARVGGKTATQGDADSIGSTRTVADPRDWDSSQAVFKVVHELNASNQIKLVVDHLDRQIDDTLLSRQGVVNLAAALGLPPIVTFQLDRSLVTSHTTVDKTRLSLEQTLVSNGAIEQLQWRLWAQQGDSRQTTLETLTTTVGGGPFGPITATPVDRTGLLTFEQESEGGEVQLGRSFADRGLLTFGGSLLHHRYDQVRNSGDRHLELDVDVPRSDGLIFPTKYFPSSSVTQSAAYAQLEMDFWNGRLELVPGVRWDDHRLDADQNDEVYLSGNLGTEPPIDLRDSSLSPRLGAIFRLNSSLHFRGLIAKGFRAPPYSYVNGGFTHIAGDLTRLPNPDLRPETSLGWELGAHYEKRSAFLALQAFSTDYDDFIELIRLGLNPATGLIEFQQQNVTAARIRGLEATAEWRPNALWRLRSAASVTEGFDRDTDQPLPSIDPSSVSVAIARSSGTDLWGAELRTTYTEAKNPNEIAEGVNQFAPPASTLVDLSGHYRIGNRLTAHVALLNLLDETYWRWSAVRGIRATSRALEFHSSPGRSLSISLRFSH